MKYLIFSDESGRWNEGKYYIRSWVKITLKEYDLLRKEVIFAKHETGVKELKWERFKKNYEKFRNIFSVDYNVFITISKPNHFNPERYNIISEIEKVPVSTGGPKLTDKIKRKIVNSAKNELFLEYFEKIHIETSKKALVAKEDPKEYKYLIDTPQYLDNEWKDIAQDCGIQQVDIIKDSANNPGIEISDIISGCIMEFLENTDFAKSAYNECIKPKMLDMNSTTIPNPNLVFYKDFTENEKKEINIFR